MARQSQWQRLFTMVALASLLLSAFSFPTTQAARAQAPLAQTSAPSTAGSPGSPEASSASDAMLAKFTTALQELARAGGTEIVTVRVLTAKTPQWPDYIKAVPLAQADELTGLNVWLARVEADYLTKLASLDYVVEGQLDATGQTPRYRDPDKAAPQITDEVRQRLEYYRNNPPAIYPQLPTTPGGWWDIGPGHSSKAAWDKGYTGAGVRVADLDSGVDFCHPDLQNTWATYDVSASRNITYNVYTENGLVSVPNYYSYFNGWPMALSPFANYALFYDMYFNGAVTDLNAALEGYSNFADTRTTGTGNNIVFDGTLYTTTHTASPLNPVYHIGYHPDISFSLMWYGERVAVLVVDENGDGVYDTVYTDLNANHDFTDDNESGRRATKADPTSCWDADGDGYYDLSGGLVYFISDGLHWPQMMDWWWGPTTYGMRAPGNGDLVAFMYDDPITGGAAHGTLTAGNIVGQGRADGDPSVYGGADIRPTWKPGGVGGMVQGGGKNAKLIAIGDIYINFTSSTEAGWLFASMGVDGYGDTNDGAQITSNSYGESATDNDDWDNRSRLITRLNTRTTYRSFPATFNQQVAHMVSTGNGAPGYGTVTAPKGGSTISVGASTQMGSTGWDSISGPDQIVWGDVIPWSNRGPSAAGHLAPAVTADGAFAAGDLTLNAWGDGWTAWETWGGTSRSCPVAAGNMALIYDAWKQRTGSFPTWQQAREIVMNGATDQNNDVLVQGAGSVNADVSTDIAAGRYGLHASPAQWYPGASLNGATTLANEPIGFAQIIQPGGTDSQAFTLNNYSPVAITAPLTATYYTKAGEYQFTVTADTTKEDAIDFNRPDYLFDVTQYAPGGVIPAGTELMVAEIIQPFDEFEPQGDNSYTNNNRYRILWYSHADLNVDGNLWTDANSSGTVNAAEIDSGEYVRFAYGYGYSTYRQVSVQDPLGRWKDGIYLGLQHSPRNVTLNHLTIKVTFFQESAWSWLSFDAPSVTVNPASSAAFTATATIPADAPYGVYEGAIEVSVPASGTVAAYTTIIPVVVNVAFSGNMITTPVTLGGQPAANTRYDNSSVNGAQDWSWRPESGDWRFYFLNQTMAPAVGTRLVVKNTWEDIAPETDIDSLVLGPTSGAYAYPLPPFSSFSFGDFSATDPTTFGPYRLEVTGKSQNRNSSAGTWLFNTATGSNTEYVVAPLASGLQEVIHHSVRFEGDKFDAPFTTTVSALTASSGSYGAFNTLVYTNTFTDTISFGSNVTHTNGLTVEVYGMSSTTNNFPGLSIAQDPSPNGTCDFNGTGWYTYTIALGSSVSAFKAHVNVGTNDLDLFLFRDANSDGTFACPGERIASSTNGSGTDDEVNLSFPAAGNYMVAIQGWQVSPNPSPMSWYYSRTDLDNTIAMRNADLTIGPAKNATFELYNTAGACNDVTADCNDGVMYVGFPDAPRLFSIPVTVNYSGPSVAGTTKTVSASTAKPGDVLTYTVDVINGSLTIPVNGAYMTDTLPANVTFGGIVSGGATYSSTLNAVLWNGNIPVSLAGSVTTAAAGFVDISGTGAGVAWPGGDEDEGHASIALPFAFPWFGSNYSTVYADVNGELCFGGACSAGGSTYNDNNLIPNVAVPNNRIAAFYEDMTGPLGVGSPLTCTPDKVYTQNDPGNSRFIIQYNNWCSWVDDQLNTFEVMLYSNGTVEVQYQTVPSAPPNIAFGAAPGNSPAGIENSGGTTGYTWSGTITNTTGWTGQSDNTSKQSIVYTVTVNNVPNGTVIANTADTNNGLGKLLTTAAANTTVTNSNLATSTEGVDKATASPNDVLTYTVVLKNTGPVTATTAYLTDTLPISTTFIAATAGATYSNTLNAVLWNGSVGAGGAVTITYQASVNTSVPNGTVINNSAQVGDGLSAWTTNLASTTIQAADLSQSSKLVDAVMASVGDVVTYTIIVRNTGAAIAANASISDTLPTGLTLIPSSVQVVSGPGVAGYVGNAVTWSGALQTGFTNTQATIRFAATVGSTPLCQTLTNTARIDDGQGGIQQPTASFMANCLQTFMPIISR